MYSYVVTEAAEIHIAKIIIFIYIYIYIILVGKRVDSSYRNVFEHLKICCYLEKLYTKLSRSHL